MSDSPEPPTFAERLESLASLPHRNPLLHWAALLGALASLGILLVWMVGDKGTVRLIWVQLDIALGGAFALEYVTRSGFRWNPIRYSMSHFFDFVAMLPVLVLIQYALPYQGIWLWVILAARAVRVIDRLLGDGFVRRNVFAIAEGLEEEITDRVILNMLARAREDMDRGRFAQRLAEALANNRDPVLRRIRETHPQKGASAFLAQHTGLMDALERAEEGTFDAVVELLHSAEMDQMLRDVVDSTFAGMQQEFEHKTWRQRLGIRPRERADQPPPADQLPP